MRLGGFFCSFLGSWLFHFSKSNCNAIVNLFKVLTRIFGVVFCPSYRDSFKICSTAPSCQRKRAFLKKLRTDLNLRIFAAEDMSFLRNESDRRFLMPQTQE